LTSDTEALLLTGPGLFPKLMDFRVEALEEADRPISQMTIVLRDLSDGRLHDTCGSSWRGWMGRREAFHVPDAGLSQVVLRVGGLGARDSR
jgi:hypothetical protein